MRLFLVIFSALSAVDGGIFVNRITVDTDLKICNVSFTHFDDLNGDGVLNGTFQNFKTITKMLFYTTFKIAEDHNDKEFKRVILSTVYDAEKMVNGKQGNIWLKSFAGVIRRSLHFEFKLPFQPVRIELKKRITSSFFSQTFIKFQNVYRLFNLTFGQKFNFWSLNTHGMINLRVVGKLAGSNATKYFANFAFYGGLR